MSLLHFSFAARNECQEPYNETSLETQANDLNSKLDLEA